MTELKRLIPLMCVGSLIGFLLLLKIKPETSLLAFAVFILLYALYALSGIQPERRFDSKHVVPFGFGGGLLGAMFGSGGFMYSIYLNGRLQDPQKSVSHKPHSLAVVRCYASSYLHLLGCIFRGTSSH